MSYPLKLFTYKFDLIDMSTLETIRTIEWELHNRWGGIMFYRSLDPAYDFKIRYDVEGDLYAEANYKIPEEELHVLLDDTGVFGDISREYEWTRGEFGRFDSEE